MKRILSILLLSAILYSITGFYIDFKIEQFLIKEEIKEKLIRSLPENELTLIKITSHNINKIRWTEDGEEFKYEDNMYDVARTKKVNDTTYYYCFNDRKENKLIASVDKLVKEQTDNNKSKTILKKPVINYFFHKNRFTQYANSINLTNLTNTIYLYISIILDITSPPPKV